MIFAPHTDEANPDSNRSKKIKRLQLKNKEETEKKRKTDFMVFNFKDKQIIPICPTSACNYASVQKLISAYQSVKYIKIFFIYANTRQKYADTMQNYTHLASYTI